MELPTSSYCRCCASEAGAKKRDLTMKYNWMVEEEVYSEMLKDCFSIDLVYKEGCNGICDECVWSLRSSYLFRKQVLAAEQKFLARIKVVPVPFSETKTAVVKLEIAADSADDDLTEETGQQPPFPQEAVKGESTKEETMDVNDLEGGGHGDLSSVETDYEEVPLLEIRKSRKININKETKHKTQKNKLQGKKQNTNKQNKRKRPKTESTPERAEHRVNLATILQNSNASPFRDKTAKGYSCLYCAKLFTTIHQLREHTALDEEKYKLNILKNHVLSYNPIKVDITDLKCTICDTEMADLNDLKDHLVTAHKKKIHKHIKDIIIPFRLHDGDDLTCVICSLEHASFKNLYHHMSIHYTNHYCPICGVGYITIGALKKHKKTHQNGHFLCRFCKKVFTSDDKRKHHEKGVHETGGWFRNKCPHCPKVFVGYYDKTAHLSEVHNEKPLLFPCNACSKVYKKKFELNRHIKNHHLQQKNYTCTVCGASFFSSRGMNDHMLRHDGNYQVYACDVCGKGFSRPRTLKEHLKTHEEDHRFECSVCNKNFTHKSSLRAHMKLHQSNLEIFKGFDDVEHLVDKRDVTLKQIALESKKKEEEEKADRVTDNPLEFFNLNL